ncbi:MAG: D-alanyl-D-alanine carboxypeptidase [Propionibacteriaceae bacterium]|jgi:D-alanyl-D-alanine carboxypeptidase|nr:D-alanyl-D-alanine carboxypeptidase [Propionibacteriaceae bacterium]
MTFRHGRINKVIRRILATLLAINVLFTGCAPDEPPSATPIRRAKLATPIRAVFEPGLESCAGVSGITPAALVEQSNTLAAQTAGEIYGLVVSSDGTTLWERNARTAATPASVMKLVVGLAALDTLGADYQLTLGIPPDTMSEPPIDWENPLPLTEVLQFTLLHSENDYAEIVLTHLGAAYGLPATTAGGAQALTQWLGEHGLWRDDPTLVDGSGLSPDNKLSPHLVVGVLQWAMSNRHDEIRALLTYLPLAGVSGTLTNRFDAEPDAINRVRAKTGTLPGVSSLAGVTPTGQPDKWTVFAVFINDSPTYTAARQAELDALVGSWVCVA